MDDLISRITAEVMNRMNPQSDICNILEKHICVLESQASELRKVLASFRTEQRNPALIPDLQESFCDPANCTGCGYCVLNNKKAVAELVSAGAIRIGSGAGIPSAPSELARYIDHTLLKPDATAEQITSLCEEAGKYKFASVCINPTWVSLAARILKNSGVKVCTVVGFPLGATPAAVKAYETRKACDDGAEEIDMVINIGALKSKQYRQVGEDISRVVEAAGRRIVKVILETALLNDEEKVMACSLSKAAGAHFVKTSTGFGPGGATVKDIELMRKSVGEDMGVKASGGVRDAAGAMEMVRAGATRIGASASVAIVTGQQGSGKY